MRNCLAVSHRVSTPCTILLKTLQVSEQPRRHPVTVGPPDPLYNCSIFNRTAAELSVRCLEAFDGGLIQSFVLRVFSAEDDHVSPATGGLRGVRSPYCSPGIVDLRTVNCDLRNVD